MKILVIRFFVYSLAVFSIVSHANPSREKSWRDLDPSNTLIMEVNNQQVIIELAPQFAPKHVDNVKKLVSQGYFDGLAITRSHDNYVVQWGDPDYDNNKKRTLGEAEANLAPEFFRNIEELNYTSIVSRDAYAEEVGFVDGFAVANNKKQAWLTHCYGAVGVGRDVAANSGNGSELYVVTGHSPRHLDLNVTLIGRVISGMEHLSSLPRGTGALGFYESREEHIPIDKIALAKKKIPISVMRTESQSFAEHLVARTYRTHEWFIAPIGKVELCNVGVPTKFIE